MHLRQLTIKGGYAGEPDIQKGCIAAQVFKADVAAPCQGRKAPSLPTLEVYKVTNNAGLMYCTPMNVLFN